MATSSSLGKALLLFLNISFVLLLLFYCSILFNSSHAPFLRSLSKSKTIAYSSDDSTGDCEGLRGHESNKAKCDYLLSGAHECDPDEGYIQYLNFFFCCFGNYPIFGYITLFLWLILLFYLLGNTTADYFCSNLEALSRLLKLHPTVAGVTLLSLGNGAPDVFSSIVSFIGTPSASLVGLNSILGGVFFVSSVVVGIISIVIGPRKISINKSCFVRDICFLLLVLLVLLAILITRKINIWGAMAFASLYLAYVLVVSMTHLYGKGKEGTPVDFAKETSTTELCDPFLDSIDKSTTTDEGKPISRILYFFELPLYLPRRLTIPDINEKRWSKPFAVGSVTLAPILLAALWVSKNESNSGENMLIYLFGVITGIIFGISAAVKTNKERPPRRFLFPWLAGGFLMSVTWTYIIAQELVSLLVSLGVILNMSPSILGLTVLAWGNSLGDLIANVAVAVNGGPLGAQVAVSGCYGGPIFNTLVGLGLSLVISSWSRYPAIMAIPKDPTLFLTLGFLIAGLIWTLVMLPRRGMNPDRVLGVGLISIYLCFLCVRLGQSLGLIELQL